MTDFIPFASGLLSAVSDFLMDCSWIYGAIVLLIIVAVIKRLIKF